MIFTLSQNSKVNSISVKECLLLVLEKQHKCLFLVRFQSIWPSLVDYGLTFRVASATNVKFINRNRTDKTINTQCLVHLETRTHQHPPQSRQKTHVSPLLSAINAKCKSRKWKRLVLWLLMCMKLLITSWDNGTHLWVGGWLTISLGFSFNSSAFGNGGWLKNPVEWWRNLRCGWSWYGWTIW